MDKHEHYGHRERMRERVRKEGLDNFQDHEVLEYALSFVIPYKDTNPIAHALIRHFGSLNRVLEADEVSLAGVDGMGKVSAMFLSSLIDFYNVYEKSKLKNVSTISSPSQALDFLRSLLGGKLTEEIYLICLSPKNKVVKVEKISKGTRGEAKVAIRMITDIVSKYSVHNIIIGHNHPSGGSTPSADDDKFTKALVTSMAINDVHLIDHLIIAEKEYYSYRVSNMLEKYLEDISGLLDNKTKIAQPKAVYEVDK